MTDIYQENILDHYKNPRNFGELNKCTHQLTGANISCGDEITWYLDINNNKIAKANFTGRACAICTASCSILSTQLIGKTIQEISDLKTKDITDNIGIPLSPVRLKCALLPLETLKDLKKG